MSKFTRQHYNAIAAILAEHSDNAVKMTEHVVSGYPDFVHGWKSRSAEINELIDDFVTLFEQDNANFDSERFLSASGYNQEI